MDWCAPMSCNDCFRKWVVMEFFDKRCPECKARIPFHRFARITSRTFNCQECGALLFPGSIGRQLLGSVSGSLFLSVPMIQARCNPAWWWALLPGLVLYVAWGYLFLAPRSAKVD